MVCLACVGVLKSDMGLKWITGNCPGNDEYDNSFKTAGFDGAYCKCGKQSELLYRDKICGRGHFCVSNNPHSYKNCVPQLCDRALPMKPSRIPCTCTEQVIQDKIDVEDYWWRQDTSLEPFQIRETHNKWCSGGKAELLPQCSLVRWPGKDGMPCMCGSPEMTGVFEECQNGYVCEERYWSRLGKLDANFQAISESSATMYTPWGQPYTLKMIQSSHMTDMDGLGSWIGKPSMNTNNRRGDWYNECAFDQSQPLQCRQNRCIPNPRGTESSRYVGMTTDNGALKNVITEGQNSPSLCQWVYTNHLGMGKIKVREGHNSGVQKFLKVLAYLTPYPYACWVMWEK